jgi:hypothetical protein
MFFLNEIIVIINMERSETASSIPTGKMEIGNSSNIPIRWDKALMPTVVK